MRVLLVGGAGHVGTCVAPYLKAKHQLRVLDMKPPQDESIEFIEGSIADPAAVERALDGMDTFITMVMKGGQDGVDSKQTVEQVVDNYTVNCLGLHLLLLTATQKGIRGGVHTGTMSSHNRNRRYYPSEEAVPLDGPNVYGLTKGLAEEICHYFAREFGMGLAVFRLSGPRSRAQFIEQYHNPTRRPWGAPLYLIDEEDMAEAYLAALEYVHKAPGRCDAFFLCGDSENVEMNMSKARAILGWEPRSHTKLGLPPRVEGEVEGQA